MPHHLAHHLAHLQARLMAASLLLVPLLLLGCSIPKIVHYDDPLTPEEHLSLGASYEARGEYDLAIKEYEEARPDSDLALLYLGNAYFQKGDVETAGSYYQKAYKRMPDHPDVLNNLAWIMYLRRERLPEAEAMAERALALNPAKADIYRDTLEHIRQALAGDAR